MSANPAASPGILESVPPVRAVVSPASRIASMSHGARIALLGIMALGMFMSLLDVQIVAASLPEVTAGLSAGPDEGTWLQTAYLIAEIVMIPLSAFLSRAFSTRWVFTASAALFTLSSIACGFAWDLDSMIAFRAVQGFVGGAMIPTVFATGYALFDGKKRALIPAILGTTATLAPILGPTLGGWITDVATWRWLFFINIVPGTLIALTVPIYGRIDEPDLSVLKGFDAWNIPLLAVFLGGLEYVLEEGPRWDWFEDTTNAVVGLASLLGAVGFFYRSFAHPQPVIDLRVFKSTRFAMGCLFQFVLGVGMFTAIYLIPQYLAQIQHYRSLEIGEAVFVTGIAQIIATPISARVSQWLDPRHMIAFGFVLFGLSMTWLTQLSPEWGGTELFLPQALRGFSIMFCIVPATNLCLGALEPRWLKTGSGVSNLMRNLGGAVGIAGANTVINERYHLHYTRLVEALTPANPAVSQWMASANAIGAGAFADGGERHRASLALLARTVNDQAMTMTFADAFVVLAIAFFAALVVVPFSRPIAPVGAAAPKADH
jgi:DHA2 family multidrug resistance protein